MSTPQVADHATAPAQPLGGERPGAQSRPGEGDAIRAALERAGVEFIDANGSGTGVRLK
jgi:hypothetical protein